MLTTLLNAEAGGTISATGHGIALSGTDVYIAKIESGQLYAKKHSGSWSTSPALMSSTTAPLIALDENGFVHVVSGSKYCRSSSANSVAAFSDHSAELPTMGAPRFFNYDSGKLGITYVINGNHYMGTYRGTWFTEQILENPGMSARGSQIVQSDVGDLRGLFAWAAITSGTHIVKTSILSSAFTIDIDCNITSFDHYQIGVDDLDNPYVVGLNSASGYLVESVPI